MVLPLLPEGEIKGAIDCISQSIKLHILDISWGFFHCIFSILVLFFIASTDNPFFNWVFSKVIRELSGLILTRAPKLCNFVEWRGFKVVYRSKFRYASLYFCMCINAEDNELEVLEIIHHFVEILDRYFGSVCELDLIFNFHKAYYILDEILLAGELQESSKKNVARLIAAQDSLVEAAKEESSSITNIIAQAAK
ncbi:AP-1 complex subunit sigma-2 [Rhynchospora pubera]|uniref:Adaptor AP-1 19 kDa protein n=1 Tax=Rhynchospora pubera TaxID=906938 RepID=A0AAV8G8E7_9POAL|nr:AP-1 complex subunit sigma-2 [Rhynchospora pubera]